MRTKTLHVPLRALLVPAILCASLLGCTANPEDARSNEVKRPIATRIPGQPGAEADVKPASAMGPTITTEAQRPVPTREAAPARSEHPGLGRKSMPPRPTPACPQGSRRVGEEDKDCAVFGQCCKPDGTQH